MTDFSPREIVSELDRYIVGQNEAKKAVAVALRNRWRRRRVPDDLRDEVTPKNILMIGPTGVGKTEIARRLAKLAQAPFLKVEATKFTEVGYVGRDVDQIVRDLVESAIAMVRDKRRAGVHARAEAAAEERILDALTGPGSTAARESFRKKLRAGELDDKEVELQLADTGPELQGRLPIRVELKALTREDLRRILVEPEANLIRQHQALLATEGVTLAFTEDAYDALADAAVAVNGAVENIGARRLQTVLERVMEEISFTAADRTGETITIDAAYVEGRIGDLARNADLSKFIL